MSLICWNLVGDLEDFLQHYPRGLERALSSDADLIKARLAGLKREDIKVKLKQGLRTLGLPMIAVKPTHNRATDIQ